MIYFLIKIVWHEEWNWYVVLINVHFEILEIILYYNRLTPAKRPWSTLTESAKSSLTSLLMSDRKSATSTLPYLENCMRNCHPFWTLSRLGFLNIFFLFHFSFRFLQINCNCSCTYKTSNWNQKKQRHNKHDKHDK